jgi:hypothetical protein
MDVFQEHERVTFASLENEYTPRYCLQLEAAYGHGMMSEGGREGIVLLFYSLCFSVPLCFKRLKIYLLFDIRGEATWRLQTLRAVSVILLEVSSKTKNSNRLICI